MSKEMKESKIPWVGNIPYTWHTEKIKYLADSTQENSFMDGDWIESPYITDVGIRYYTTGNIGDGVFKEQGNGYISQDTFEKLNCKYAYPDDFVIARLNTPFGRACILPNESDKYVLAVDIVILRTKENKKYLNYLMQCEGYHAAVGELARGTTMLRISRSNLGNIHLPIPPRTEQDTIVKYLDKYCNAIDSSISRHQQIIEKLEEYRRSVITETLSGNNDEVRIHLQSIKVKYLISSIHSGDSLNADEIDNESAFPVYGGGKSLGRCKKYNVCDVIVIGRGGANCGCVTNIHGKAWATDNALVVTTYNNQNYLSFLLGSTNLRSNDNATAQPLVTGTKIRNTRVMATTDPQEQQYIAQYLTRINEEVNQRISQHFQMIAKLQEYKQSLIYNAVTGKIDCRAAE